MTTEGFWKAGFRCNIQHGISNVNKHSRKALDDDINYSPLITTIKPGQKPSLFKKRVKSRVPCSGICTRGSSPASPAATIAGRRTAALGAFLLLPVAPPLLLLISCFLLVVVGSGTGARAVTAVPRPDGEKTESEPEPEPESELSLRSRTLTERKRSNRSRSRS